jgi:hypothetical protein
MKLRTFLFSAIVAAIAIAPVRAAQTPEELAQTAADSWLKLTDAGEFGTAWDQAAKAFRDALPKEQWTQALSSARPPLGKAVSRKVTSRKYSESIPGAPQGKYVIIQYETAFEKKDSASVETITLMLDPDGVWRAAGYFVR